MTRALALLTPVSLAVLYSLACSPPPSCFDGTWPSNGATGVPADTLLQIDFGQDPSEFPALPPGVTLFDETDGVPVDITVTADGRTLTAEPAAPLLDGHTYVLTGVDRSALDWSSVNRSAASSGRNITGVAEFTVGGAPTVLAAWHVSFDTVGLVFSEPMARGSFNAANLDTTVTDPSTGEDFAGTAGAATWSDDDRSVEIRVDWPDDARTWDEALILTLDRLDGLRAARGPALADPGPLDLELFNPYFDPRPGLTGASYCEGAW